MITAYLASDRDVCCPQLLVRLEDRQKFEAAALDVGTDRLLAHRPGTVIINGLEISKVRRSCDTELR